MPKALVIVESPAKAKTINKYLGKEYVVKASLGHIKDLPKRDLAVDVDHGFEPRYEVIEGKKKLIAELKQTARKVQEVYLAADPDREGEAICYHLQEELGDKQERPAHLPGDVQRDHQEGRPEGLRKTGAGEYRPGGCAAGAARARPAGGLQDFAAAVGQGPARPFRRPRADGGAAAGGGARARNPRVPEEGILDHRCGPGGEEAAAAHRAPHQAERRDAGGRRERGRRRHRGAARRRRLRRQVRGHAREKAQPGGPLHHLHACSRNPRASCASA